VVVEATKQAYSRDEVRRLLGVSERLLKSWEKQKFLSAGESFSFSDLLALRTLVGLRANKITPLQIRSAINAIRTRLEVGNPLREVKIYSDGKRIAVSFNGQKMEPVSGQLLLDFDEVEIKKLLSFPRRTADAGSGKKQRREAERWFERGLELEQTGAAPDEIIEAYKKACELDPGSAGALVNLGTVYFNLREWKDAERQYQKALIADPNYPLAHYNLGNLCDELGDRHKALGHYLGALKLQSNYADAHYNVALVYQSIGQPLKAVHHWKIYLKLDPNSAWADIARRELSKLRDSTIVRGNTRLRPTSE
jgi:tetratricopeptide (TPR) repeat protein